MKARPSRTMSSRLRPGRRSRPSLSHLRVARVEKALRQMGRVDAAAMGARSRLAVVVAGLGLCSPMAVPEAEVAPSVVVAVVAVVAGFVPGAPADPGESELAAGVVVAVVRRCSLNWCGWRSTFASPWKNSLDELAST
jgi:hypothetical protein